MGVDQFVAKMKIGSIVIRAIGTKCWYSGSKRSTTSPESVPNAAGWFFAILKEEGPICLIDQVPEQRSGKRSRLHLDFYTDNRECEVERLVKVGATRYPWRYKPGDDFVVLEDPDGNLFCVVQVPRPKLQGERKQTEPIPRE